MIDIKKFNKIILTAIKNSKIKTSSIAKRLKISRSTLYRKIKSKKIDNDFIMQIGKIINYDFHEEIKKLNEEKENNKKNCLCNKKNIYLSKSLKNKKTIIIKINFLV